MFKRYKYILLSIVLLFSISLPAEALSMQSQQYRLDFEEQPIDSGADTEMNTAVTSLSKKELSNFNAQGFSIEGQDQSFSILRLNKALISFKDSSTSLKGSVTLNSSYSTYSGASTMITLRDTNKFVDSKSTSAKLYLNFAQKTTQLLLNKPLPLLSLSTPNFTDAHDLNFQLNLPTNQPQYSQNAQIEITPDY